MSGQRVISRAIYLFSAAIGILAFIYPFLTPIWTDDGARLTPGRSAPLLTAALVGLSMVALWVEIQGEAIGAKMVAMLGVLVAIASVLRFIEVAIPLPGGFSPIFVPIILSGYVLGGRFGFLMGLFTLLVSAIITGGVGPWLPYQMFAAGWTGLTAGWLGRGVPKKDPADSRPGSGELLLLSGFGFGWGLLYGLIMNIYFWPYATGTPEQTWTPGIGLGEMVSRYAAFYAVTSLGWDLIRAVGNLLLILLLAAPTIRVLKRFQRRLHFKVQTDHA